MCKCIICADPAGWSGDFKGPLMYVIFNMGKNGSLDGEFRDRPLVTPSLVCRLFIVVHIVANLCLSVTGEIFGFITLLSNIRY